MHIQDLGSAWFPRLVALALTCLPLTLPANDITVASSALTPNSSSSVATDRRIQNAFGNALPNLPAAEFPNMVEGKRVFARTWAETGTGPVALQGLGPLYNADSCTSCHFKDGRGDHGQTPPPLIFRLTGKPASNSPAATWGAQLQDHAVHGEPEGRVEITFETLAGYYADGSAYYLKKPIYHLAGDDGYTCDNCLAPRIPPTLIGVGLLEAADPDAIITWADPHDDDGDNISGRVNWVGAGSNRRPGRFGWKAAQPGLPEQVAGALAEDMGIVSAMHGVADAVAEIDRTDFARMIDYLRFLGPPPQRTDQPQQARGRQLFNQAGCDGCHRPAIVTIAATNDSNPDDLPDVVLAQEIAPYTDFLLHDLGVALADGDGDNELDREWRTPPLWGLGLMKAVNGQLLLLHDGRANTFEEAILWYGGEAATASEAFRRFNTADREALVAFLASI